jgi:DNA-binding CsgD family transcriptional regulator
MSNSFITILDPRSTQYLHVTPNSIDILGYPPSTWMEGGVRKQVSFIHRQELPAIINFHEMGMKIFNLTQAEQRMGFKEYMDIRLQCKSGVYRKFLRTSVPLALDSQGNVLAWLNSFQDITHLKKDKFICFLVREADMQMRIFQYSMDTKELDRVSPFTRREKEVLEALSFGMDTNQIAEKLSITPTTVGTHKRKLVEKTATCNTESMVTYLNMVGLMNGRALG